MSIAVSAVVLRSDAPPSAPLSLGSFPAKTLLTQIGGKAMDDFPDAVGGDGTAPVVPPLLLFVVVVAVDAGTANDTATATATAADYAVTAYALDAAGHDQLEGARSLGFHFGNSTSDVTLCVRSALFLLLVPRAVS